MRQAEPERTEYSLLFADPSHKSLDVSPGVNAGSRKEKGCKIRGSWGLGDWKSRDFIWGRRREGERETLTTGVGEERQRILRMTPKAINIFVYLKYIYKAHVYLYIYE